MRKFFISTLLFISIFCNSQVGINTTGDNPDPSAMLDVKSTSKGVLITKMTKAQRQAIASPAKGLLVYQTDDIAGFYYNDGTPTVINWVKIQTVQAPLSSTQFATLGFSKGTYSSLVDDDLLVFTGNDLWAVCNSCGAIFKQGWTGTGGATHFPDGTIIWDVAFDGINIWATDYNGHYFKIDGTTSALLGTYTSLAHPTNMAFNGTNLWIISDHTVNRIDISSGAVLASVDMGAALIDLAFDFNGNMWVVTANNTVIKNGPTGIVYPVGTNPQAVVFDGSTMWISSLISITRIQYNSGAIVGNYPIAGTKMAFDGDNMWILTPGGGIAKLNGAGQILQFYNFPNNGYGEDIIFDGTYIWAADGLFLTRIAK